MVIIEPSQGLDPGSIPGGRNYALIQDESLPFLNFNLHVRGVFFFLVRAAHDTPL